MTPARRTSILQRCLTATTNAFLVEGAVWDCAFAQALGVLPPSSRTGDARLTCCGMWAASARALSMSPVVRQCQPRSVPAAASVGAGLCLQAQVLLLRPCASVRGVASLPGGRRHLGKAGPMCVSCSGCAARVDRSSRAVIVCAFFALTLLSCLASTLMEIANHVLLQRKLLFEYAFQSPGCKSGFLASCNMQ